jgi:hypothetical protein
VCGFINNGDKPLNVTRISGTIIDAVSGVVVQNLTTVNVPTHGEIVEGGMEMTFEYVFTPDVPETTMAQVRSRVFQHLPLGSAIV